MWYYACAKYMLLKGEWDKSLPVHERAILEEALSNPKSWKDFLDLPKGNLPGQMEQMNSDLNTENKYEHTLAYDHNKGTVSFEDIFNFRTRAILCNKILDWMEGPHVITGIDDVDIHMINTNQVYNIIGEDKTDLGFDDVPEFSLKLGDIVVPSEKKPSVFRRKLKYHPKWSKLATESLRILYTKLEKVLTKLKTYEPFSAPFLEPVSQAEVPDYYEIIKIPMDLSKITSNLDSLAYNSKAEFERDLNLIWKNCFTYNKPGSIYRSHAISMKRRAEKLLINIKEVSPVAHVERTDSDIDTTPLPTRNEFYSFAQLKGQNKIHANGVNPDSEELAMFKLIQGDFINSPNEEEIGRILYQTKTKKEKEIEPPIILSAENDDYYIYSDDETEEQAKRYRMLSGTRTIGDIIQFNIDEFERVCLKKNNAVKQSDEMEIDEDPDVNAETFDEILSRDIEGIQKKIILENETPEFLTNSLSVIMSNSSSNNLPQKILQQSLTAILASTGFEAVQSQQVLEVLTDILLLFIKNFSNLLNHNLEQPGATCGDSKTVTSNYEIAILNTLAHNFRNGLEDITKFTTDYYQRIRLRSKGETVAPSMENYLYIQSQKAKPPSPVSHPKRRWDIYSSHVRFCKKDERAIQSQVLYGTKQDTLPIPNETNGIKIEPSNTLNSNTNYLQTNNFSARTNSFSAQVSRIGSNYSTSPPQDELIQNTLESRTPNDNNIHRYQTRLSASRPNNSVEDNEGEELSAEGRPASPSLRNSPPNTRRVSTTRARARGRRGRGRGRSKGKSDSALSPTGSEEGESPINSPIMTPPESPSQPRRAVRSTRSKLNYNEEYGMDQ